MKIHIAADHGGYALKEHLIKELTSKGYDIEDHGCHSEESVDFPKYSNLVCNEVIKSENTYGILVCGTGIGMNIASNKKKGIRSALLSDVFSAKVTKEHNNTNVMCLGQRVIGFDLATMITETWLESKYLGGKYQRRIDMIEETENEQ